MPIHDWTKVRANRFHDFHQSWTIRIRDALNAGLLPDGYFAMAEQKTRGPEPDVVALSSRGDVSVQGGIAVLDTPPKARVHMKVDAPLGYAAKANRIAVRHPDGDLISIIEIVSPGNKDSRHAIQDFSRKIVNYLFAGVHVLVVDLFPPNKRNPNGIHQVIWDRIQEVDFKLPEDKPLTLASYSAWGNLEAFVEPVAVGDPLTDMALFLDGGTYVHCPLESTYQASWDVMPAALKSPMLS